MKTSRVFSLLFFSLLLTPIFASGTEYIANSGENLQKISQKLKIPYTILLRANPDVESNGIKPGDKLLVPESYMVKTGDTLYSLSRSWGLDLKSIQEWNKIDSPSGLKVGTTIYIPVLPRAKKSEDKYFWPVDGIPVKEGGKLRAVTFDSRNKPFFSVCEGVIVYHGEFRGVGRVLLVQNSEKTMFAYGNFDSSEMTFGQKVKKGQLLGQTSNRAGNRLYFFAFRQGEALDPFEIRR